MNRQRLRALGLVAALVAGGCAKSADGPPPVDEAAVRAAVTSLQESIHAHDSAKVWDLLDAKAQSDADQAAAAVRAKYLAADEAGKAELTKKYGLTGAELEKLTGPDVIKTQPFWRKYDELPEGRIEKVSVQGKQATVTYVEPDGDREKLTLNLRDGRWKAVLAIPKE